MRPNYLVQTDLIDGSLANFLKTAAVLCLCVFPSLCLTMFLHRASVFHRYNNKHHSITERVVVVIISSSSISIIITIHHRHHHHQQHQDQHYDHHDHHPKHDPSHDRSYPPSRCSSCVETNSPCCIPSEKTCRVWEPQRTFSSGLPCKLTSAGSQLYGFEDIHAEHPTDEFETWSYAQFRAGTWKARISVKG